jgi:hypothetical protein
MFIASAAEGDDPTEILKTLSRIAWSSGHVVAFSLIILKRYLALRFPFAV